MCKCKIKKIVGLCSLTFGLGILMSYFLPGFLLAFLESVALVVAGIILLGLK